MPPMNFLLTAFALFMISFIREAVSRPTEGEESYVSSSDQSDDGSSTDGSVHMESSEEMVVDIHDPDIILLKKRVDECRPILEEIVSAITQLIKNLISKDAFMEKLTSTEKECGNLMVALTTEKKALTNTFSPLPDAAKKQLHDEFNRAYDGFMKHLTDAKNICGAIREKMDAGEDIADLGEQLARCLYLATSRCDHFIDGIM